jgi:hypothetical protein
MRQDPYGDAESLFRAHYRRVVGVAYSLARDKAEAEDIAQEGFCGLPTGSGSFPGLASASSRLPKSRWTRRLRAEMNSRLSGLPSASCRKCNGTSSACTRDDRGPAARARQAARE